MPFHSNYIILNISGYKGTKHAESIVNFIDQYYTNYIKESVALLL